MMRGATGRRLRAASCALLLAALGLAVVLASVLPFSQAQAKDGALDEILDYTITVDVNEDATLTMLYHIDWKVLDSTSDGPLTWVRIGIPNSRYVSLEGLSPAVDSIRYSATGGSYARVNLDRAYKADEVASIDFKLVQDYMYQMNRDNEGETVYEFTPGWFDDIQVDNLTVRWNAEKVSRFAPACQQEGGYLTWSTALDHGKRYTVTVAYPNDAFAFDAGKEIQQGNESSDDDLDPVAEFFSIIAALAIIIATPVIIIIWIRNLIWRIVSIFRKDSGFSAGKRITRTKVVYYPTCPGCGAGRPEGKDTCEYCGGSFIKSEEVIQAKDLPSEEGALKRKRTDGLYPFASSPDTYLRVHVVPVPVSSGSSSSRSSCVSSSCACACACGCACACACAGGGRAGCTAKDFYNTDLKLRQLKQ